MQCALLLAGMMMAFTACGDDDEPKTQGIDYYIEVEEEFLVDGLVDHTDRYYSDEYADKIVKRAKDPNAFVPIEIKLAK